MIAKGICSIAFPPNSSLEERITRAFACGFSAIELRIGRDVDIETPIAELRRLHAIASGLGIEIVGISVSSLLAKTPLNSVDEPVRALAVDALVRALRLARAFTGRSKIIKFAGHYHGHSDMLLVQAGSGVATMGLPDSPGVPPEATSNTLIAPYNDSAAVEELFRTYPQEIAAVIVEPVAANMGLVLPLPAFLETLRELTE